MKVTSLKAKGVGRFHEEVELPVEQLGEAKVVAVTGLTGAGKTTLLELVPSLAYGKVPSHGLLSAMCNASDSFVDGLIETDQVYRLYCKVNATLKTPKTEAYLYDAEGNPLNDGKLSTFKAELSKRFPSEQAYSAGGFTAQKRGGQFLEIGKSERKALFAEMLGLGRLQLLSEAAAKRARGCESERIRLVSAIDTLRARVNGIEEIRSRLEQSEQSVSSARSKREAIEAEDAAWQVSHETWTKKADELKVASTKADEAKLRADHAAELARTKWKALSEQARANTNTREALQGKLDGRDGLQSRMVDEDFAARIKILEDEIHTHQTQLQAERDAKHNLLFLKADADAAFSKFEDNLRAASGLDKVPCGGKEGFSSCALIATAVAARSRRAEDERVSGITKDKLAAHQRIIAQMPARQDVSGHQKLIDKARSDESEQLRIRTELGRMDEFSQELESLCIAAADLGAEIDALTKAGREAAAKQEECTADASTHQQSLADHQDKEPQQVWVDIDRVRSEETRASVELGGLEEQLRAAEKATEEISDLEKQHRDHVANLDDWKHLATALGRDGVQALEIDAAGPEVSDLTNELLHSCYGSRFTATLETTALKKDGKGTKEVFDLLVIDSERGTHGSASDLSGGERVIVSEALSLAIAIYNTQRSSVPILDLFRDECSGALDYEKAPKYVAMIRRAVELGGFNRVYFVAHQRELWPLADARIVVKDGRAVVQ